MGSSNEFDAILPPSTPPSSSTTDKYTANFAQHRNYLQDPSTDIPVTSTHELHSSLSSPMTTYAGSVYNDTSSSPAPSWHNSSSLTFGPFPFSPSVGPEWLTPYAHTAKSYFTTNMLTNDSASDQNGLTSPALPSTWDKESITSSRATPSRHLKAYLSRYINAYGSPAIASESTASTFDQAVLESPQKSIQGMEPVPEKFKDKYMTHQASLDAFLQSDRVANPLATLVEDGDGDALQPQTWTRNCELERVKDVNKGNDVLADEEGNGGGSLKHRPPPQGSVSYFSLLKYADKWDRLLMVLGTLGALVNGASLPAFSVLFGEMVERLGRKDDLKSVQKVCLWMALLAFSTMISSYIEVAAWALAAERQALRIRSKYLRGVLRQDVAFFDLKVETGGLLHRITTDVDCIQDTIGHKTASFLHYSGTFTIGYIVGFIKCWQVSLVVFFSSLTMVVIGLIQHHFLAKLARKEEESHMRASTLAHQALSSIRTVYACGAEEEVYRQYAGALKGGMGAGVRAGFARGASVAAFYLISYLIWAAVLWYGAILVAARSVRAGDAVACFFATIISGRCLGLALQYLSSFTEGSVAAWRVFGMIERVPPAIDVYSSAGLLLDEVRGQLDFHHVTFAYPARPRSPVLRHFTLTVSAGSTVALVGPSGSGKSTIFSLLQRLYDPNEGEIYLDDVNIQLLQLRWLREKIALVGQEPVLFATSIHDNILYGKENATSKEIEAAARLANAHDFISVLPQRYDTQVGELGAQLSGGQKQRIAIARAVLKDPTILLLDEATSALDNESEGMVQRSLDQMMRNRTTMVIAHRLSSIRHVPLIVVVKDGSVVEQGSHETLLRNPSGMYTSLVSGKEATKVHASTQRANFSSPTAGSPYSSHFSSSPIASTPQYYSAETMTPNQPEDPSKGTALPAMRRKLSYPSCYETKEKHIPLSRIIAMSRADIPLLILGLFGAVNAGVTLPAYSYVISITINHYYDTDVHGIKKIANQGSLVIMWIGLACYVAMMFQYGFCNWAGIKLTRLLRERMFASTLRKEVAWFDREENSSGSLVTRVSVESSRVRGLLGDRYSVLFMGIASIGAALIICYRVNWKMTLLATALTPFFLSSNYMEALLINVGGGAREVHTNAKSTTIASEAVSNIRTVASFGVEEKVVHWFVSSLSDSSWQSIRRTQLAGAALGIAEALNYASYALLLYYGSILVDRNETDFAHVIKVFLVLVLSCFSVGSLSRLMPDHDRASAAARTVFHIIDHEPQVKNNSMHRLDRVRGEIQFQRVTFSYPARPDIQIFKGFDLKIRAGAVMALVGGSGSGKSTVIALVERFYDPDRGQILLDGFDIRDLDLKWLRNQMALVSQEPVLFACSIWENIAYGKHNATMAEIEEAARVADAHDFISSLREGYTTQVGERGVQMSGGQKQRIAMARAVLKNPRVLLLDEPTSALDLQSERKVQAALDKVMFQRTTLVVAHRLSTIRNADRIAVINAGQVVELGAHERLMKNTEGLYYRMVMAQSQ